MEDKDLLTEDSVEVPAEETGADPVVDETAAKLAEAEDKLAYLAAEFENYKRQVARRVDDERVRTERRLLEKLLPALDNFNLALQHAGTAKDVASLKVGLDYVGMQMESALREAGLEPIPTVGQPFDPNKHEALEELEGTDKPSGTIVEEAQRGYSLNGQLLRASRVKVAR